jgi:hypothetical protein
MKGYDEKEQEHGAFDWSDCPLVEVIPGKVSGAPLLKDTRLPVEAITGNYDASAMRDCRRTRPLPKLSIATRKLASTPSGPFLPIAPSINSRRSIEGSVR